RCANRKSRASRKADADMLSPPLRAVPPDRTVRRRGSGLLQPLPDAAALMAQLYAVSVCHYEAPVTPLSGGRLLRCARNDRGCCHCEERSAAAIPDGAAPTGGRLLRCARNDRGCCHCEERSAAAIPDGAAPTGGRLLRCARNDRGCCHCEERSDAAIPDGATVRETASLRSQRHRFQPLDISAISSIWISSPPSGEGGAGGRRATISHDPSRGFSRI